MKSSSMQQSAAAGQCVSMIMLGARKATMYLSKDLVVKATARFKYRKDARSRDMVLTIGKPNYAERHFVAKMKKCRLALPKRPLVKAWD